MAAYIAKNDFGSFGCVVTSKQCSIQGKTWSGFLNSLAEGAQNSNFITTTGWWLDCEGHNKGLLDFKSHRKKLRLKLWKCINSIGAIFPNGKMIRLLVDTYNENIHTAHLSISFYFQISTYLFFLGTKGIKGYRLPWLEAVLSMCVERSRRTYTIRTWWWSKWSQWLTRQRQYDARLEYKIKTRLNKE